MMPEGSAPHVPGFGAPAPGMPPQAMHPGTHAQGPAAMPAAPGDRRGELQQGGTRTVYEFTGAAAARDTASKGTFIGATLDLSHHKEERESNLRSGASTWIFLAVAVICAVGVTAYFMIFHADGAAADDTEAAAAAAAPVEPAAAPEEAKAPEPEEDAKAADDAKADDAKADDAKADEPKADDAKADEPKADEPKADEPKADEPKADAPKADAPKPKATKPRKKTTTTKKPSTSKPSTGGKTLSPKKPPRDPLKGLPKPP